MDLNKLYDTAKKPDAGTGVMFHLPDMGVLRSAYPGKSFIAGMQDAFTASDHGTMIAGILFSWCPLATLVSYRVASDVSPELTNTPRLLSAFDIIIELVKTYPAYKHIVSVSQAVGMTDAQAFRLQGQLQRLEQLGAIVVCGAGNDGRLGVTVLKYPACLPEPICVTACDNEGNRAPFSSVLNEADCCALGVMVASIGADGQATTANGTSFAAPQVAGMAGMIWQDGMTANDVWDKLKGACVDMGAKGCDPYFGWGIVDPTKLTAGKTAESVDDVLKPGSSGAAVIEMQNLLLAQGFDLPKYGADGDYGAETEAAVREFQAAYDLTVDGIAGDKTLALLYSFSRAEPVTGNTATAFITKAREALGGLYVWGGQGHKATPAYINARAKLYPQYFTGGRLSMMLKRAMTENLWCWDCSGLVCWVLTTLGIKPSGYDTNAAGLYSACPQNGELDITRLVPGCLLFKHNGKKISHVGIYTGNGCIEAAGGAYGVVECNAISGAGHSAKSYVDGKTYRLPDWTHYGIPVWLSNSLPTPAEPAVEETEQEQDNKACAQVLQVTGQSVNLRRAPGTDSEVEGVLHKGDTALAMPAVDGWRECAAQIGSHIVKGYVSDKYVAED